MSGSPEIEFESHFDTLHELLAVCDSAEAHDFHRESEAPGPSIDELYGLHVSQV